MLLSRVDFTSLTQPLALSSRNKHEMNRIIFFCGVIALNSIGNERKAVGVNFDTDGVRTVQSRPGAEAELFGHGFCPESAFERD